MGVKCRDEERRDTLCKGVSVGHTAPVSVGPRVLVARTLKGGSRRQRRLEKGMGGGGRERAEQRPREDISQSSEQGAVQRVWPSWGGGTLPGTPCSAVSTSRWHLQGSTGPPPSIWGASPNLAVSLGRRPSLPARLLQPTLPPLHRSVWHLLFLSGNVLKLILF